jgi:hypothetical protein
MFREPDSSTSERIDLVNHFYFDEIYNNIIYVNDQVNAEWKEMIKLEYFSKIYDSL